jgi:peptide deformylase
MTRKPKLLDIHLAGDKCLIEKAKPVQDISPEIKNLVNDMILTMYEKDGVGLAAPQVGKSLRIFVCDPDWSKTDVKNPLIIINPEFLNIEGEQSSDEGCLSVPGIFEKVKRFDKVTLKYLDLHGKEQIIEAEGFFAVVLQHEYDHLDGILFIDKIPKIRQLVIKKKVNLIKSSTDENGENIRHDI